MSLQFERLPGPGSERGGGPPVVALHGFLGRPEMYADLAGRLGGITAAVLPGHGREPSIPRGGFLEIAAQLADALPIDEPAVVVGYSMGGRLALGMAAQRPWRFARVVVVGSSPGLDGDRERAERVAWEAEQGERLLSGGLAAFVDAWERKPLFATQRRLAAAARDAQRAQRLAHTDAGIARALGALGLGRMPRLDLAGMRVPVVAVAGALDAKYAALSRAIAAEAPVGRSIVVPGAGHNVALEAPDALAVVLADARRESIQRGDAPWVS